MTEKFNCPANGDSVVSPCKVKRCLFNAANVDLDLPPIPAGCLLTMANQGGDDPIARLRAMIGNDGRRHMTLPSAVKAVSGFGTAMRDYSLMFESMPPASNTCKNCGYTADSFSGVCVSTGLCSSRKEAAERARKVFEDSDSELVPSLAQVWEAVIAQRDAHLPFDLRQSLRSMVGHADRPHSSQEDG